MARSLNNLWSRSKANVAMSMRHVGSCKLDITYGKGFPGT
jgi:hypothetical protein